MKVIPETSPNVLFDFTHKINESGVCSKEKTGFFFVTIILRYFKGKVIFRFMEISKALSEPAFTIIIGFQLVTFFANIAFLSNTPLKSLDCRIYL